MEHATPSQAIFDQMKSIAISIWNTYDNTYHYVDEKLDRIRPIVNYKDNAMVFYRMFDSNNQAKFLFLSPSEIIEYINENL